MKRILALLALGTLALADAQAPRTVTVPRQRVNLTCADTYWGAPRKDFLLADETYPNCVLRLPLALRERWPGPRTFYFIPRVSATLYTKDGKGNGHWLPLAPLVNPGDDPLHRAVSAQTYKTVELGGQFRKLSDVAGGDKSDTVGVGGKLTVCVAPVWPGEDPCVTFDITARYRVYTH
ncbi:hypothetical protein [Deinococcus apachensis]|uniref:hypothetical protein n=1 Tax=Deinococcus apachensis TaxID=309886 RepID=UPI00037E350F|nr:hypothetical protein [Deinococcus apachensis]